MLDGTLRERVSFSQCDWHDQDGSQPAAASSDGPPSPEAQEKAQTPETGAAFSDVPRKNAKDIE